MNASELAAMMLQWEAQRKALDELEKQIEQEVLALGKTFTVGNVRASYTQGRTTYDYEGAVKAQHVPEHIVEMFTTPKVDWRAICNEQGLDVEILKADPPSVKVKLLEE